MRRLIIASMLVAGLALAAIISQPAADQSARPSSVVRIVRGPDLFTGVRGREIVTTPASVTMSEDMHPARSGDGPPIFATR